MSRPKVYFVHEPLRFDHVTGQMVPIYNIDTATEYGDIVFALPGRNRPSTDPEASLPELRAVFGDFCPGDYLALAGDLHLIVWASVLATRAIGANPLQLLKWFSKGNRYTLYKAVP